MLNKICLKEPIVTSFLFSKRTFITDCWAVLKARKRLCSREVCLSSLKLAVVIIKDGRKQETDKKRDKTKQ